MRQCTKWQFKACSFLAIHNYADFVTTVAQKMANPPDACTYVPVLSNRANPVLNATVSGVDEVMREARKDHSAAVRVV